MKVRSVSLVNFMLHDATDLELPERGVILITGPNFSGKSSLPEAIAYAGWGKTLRGTSPWRQNAKGTVVVETDRFVVSRTHNASGGSKLSLDMLDSEGSNQTSQIAQATLQDLIGPWEVWRRTSVFSSQDAALFTCATDGERKRLVEHLISLSPFDAAQKLCKADLKEAKKKHSNATQAGERARIALTGQRQRLADAEHSLSLVKDDPEPPTEVPDATALQAEEVRLRGLIVKAEQTLREERVELSKLDRMVTIAEGKVAEAKKRARFFEQDKCPTCEQKIPAKAKQAAARVVEECQCAAEQARQGAEEESSFHREEVTELEEMLKALRAKHGEAQGRVASATAEKRRIEAEHSAWVAGRKQAEAAERAKADAEKLITRSEVEERKANGEAADLEPELTELEAVEQVLGLTGFRAHVLSHALHGIEVVSNRWLAEIVGADIQLQLKSYTEKKSGGISDKISMHVHGAGGGQGYYGCSGGERRRIDVSILLALAEVAMAARGKEAGTMIFDEVFDTLDSSGVEAVCGALATLSRDRNVIVISHSDELADALSPSLRVRVDSGRVKVW